MKHPINERFGKRIAALRRRQNLSQEELAFRCDIHRTYIGALERGEKSPTIITVEKLARGLGIETFQLFIQQSLSDGNQ